MDLVASDEADEVWRPLGLDGEDAFEYDALAEGVPTWMAQSFWDWVRERFTRRTRDSVYARFDLPLLREVERTCRISVGYVGGDISNGVAELRRSFELEGRALQLADYLLSRERSLNPGLDRLLRESGSAWTVGMRAGRPGLVRRVPEGVERAFEGVTHGSSRAGARLAEAWSAAFGVSPDPSRAYALAVKAVEDAAIPVVTPRDRDATLGKVVQVMQDQGKWAIPMTREHPRVSSTDVLLGMIRVLWAGQSDRHGGETDRSVPVTQASAEAAVLLAVPLVQWFTAGTVRRTQG
jgi:hypothetical protein